MSSSFLPVATHFRRSEDGLLVSLLPPDASSLLFVCLHDPFDEAFVQAARRRHPGSFAMQPAEQVLSLRIDEGARGQIHTRRVDPLSAGSGPPAEFNLLPPRAGELPLKLE